MIYTCTTFTGYYPVGTAAVVDGADAEHAAWRLNEKLKKQGLPGDARPENMIQFPLGEDGIVILCDGNY